MSDLISRCELFNRLATIPASPEANELKAQIYAVIQSMDAVEEETDLEREFMSSDVQFVTEISRDGKPMVWMMDNVETLAFNIWSCLTRAEPLFDEVRIRVATEENIKEWEDAEC